MHAREVSARHKTSQLADGNTGAAQALRQADSSSAMGLQVVTGLDATLAIYMAQNNQRPASAAQEFVTTIIASSIN